MDKLLLPITWHALSRASFRMTAEQIQSLMPPHDFDPVGDGLGSEWAWGFRFDCGLQVLVTAYASHAQVPPGRWIEWGADINEPYADHFAAHTAWEVRWQGPATEVPDLVAASKAFAVMRLDDNGNRFEVGFSPSLDQAACYARFLEGRAHEQTYSVEQRLRRFIEPGPPPEKQKWAVVRQDDNGNRFRIAVGASRWHAERLAAAYQEETATAQKQSYWIERVYPETSPK